MTAWHDIKTSLQSSELVFYLAFSNVKARYMRSVLGPLWLTLAAAVGAAGLGWLWSELLKVPRETFVPMLTAGLIIWQFVAGVITESSSNFTAQAGVIKNTTQPYFIHPLQKIITHLINFAHTLPVYLVVMFLLDVKPTWAMLWFFPALVLLTLNLLFFSLMLGIVGARFRDLEYIVNMAMPLLFFISPVFYRPNYLPFSETILWWNPFSHLIELLRQPLLGHPPQDFVWLTNIAFLVIGALAAVILFHRKRHRIAFWV